ncbi:hemerythrin domain-containing protein [Bacillus tuaregi]|uniref:hemerythrin domain-containing protein n=1 Tax=Bacillus tuaregi TaxID=1816695 RepID=UPI0008F8F84B|nr:hemerythrin domain-containing protein [Bacillus tuaregi]
MSGPSLYKLDAHRSIHDGVVTEGRDLLNLLLKVRREKLENHEKHARMTAEALIDHWETRLIAHADSEEENFYNEKIKENPELATPLTMLKRDHDLFRTIIDEVKQLMKKDKISDEMVDYFKAIYVLAKIHNQHEEGYLFDQH